VRAQIAEMIAKQAEYAESALACFFAALRYDAAAAAPLVPRMLAMMAHNSNSKRDGGGTGAPMAAVVKEELAYGGCASTLPACCKFIWLGFG
jgi:hypothetical protein